jgi:GTP pyrophosphokinase
MSASNLAESAAGTDAVDVFRRRLGVFAPPVDASACLAERALDFVAMASQASGRQLALARAVDAASILLGIEADEETIATALVVGAIPSTEIDSILIADAFGTDVAALVVGCLRAGRIEALNPRLVGGADRQPTAAGTAPGLESLRKMLLAMADDVRVVLIKLAERVVLMRAMTQAPDAERRAAARQTQDLFAPLANRLGVFAIKWELEDFSFRYQQPELYREIATRLDGKRREREAFIERVLATLRTEIDKLGLRAELTGRPKHIWSIHRKMQSKNLAFEALFDIRAVRIQVDGNADCYAALGLVHNLWQPITGEFDDYIAQPKANHYQSLHTAVIGPEGKTLEVQIRTFAMHAASEHGVAAHWRYKEGAGHKTAADRKFEAKIAWLREMLEWKSELAQIADKEGSSLSEPVRQGLFNDTIYVFTPQGRVIDLPAGATPVDFAYHLHTDLGHRCRGAKVDGVLVPLNTRLENAQRVEILAAKQGGPSRDWLNPQLGFLASHRALAKVRTWFRQEYFEVDVAHGRQTLERELARAGASAIALEKVATALNHKDLEECLAEIGRGEISSHQVEIALRELTLAKAAAPAAPVFGELSQVAPSAKSSGGVLVLGLNNIATMLAKCCKPLPPDGIVGFVTKTRGVMVHRLDCSNIVSLGTEQRERLMTAAWGDTGSQPFAADIEVIAADRQGLLRDISEAFSHERINVTAVNTLSRGTLASMRFTIEIRRGDELVRVLRSIGEVAGVESVRRR